MIYQDNFKAFIKGLLGVHEVPEASLSYKFLEEACLRDYLSVMGDYPEWQCKEQGKDWPQETKESHANLLQNAQNREKKILRNAIKNPGKRGFQGIKIKFDF